MWQVYEICGPGGCVREMTLKYSDMSNVDKLYEIYSGIAFDIILLFEGTFEECDKFMDKEICLA